MTQPRCPMKLKHTRRGQMITSEYVLLFFIAVAAISAMTVMVQRGLQARQRDARFYMHALASEGCSQATQGGVDCMGTAMATADRVEKYYQYEPYYGNSQAQVLRSGADKAIVNEDGTWGKYFSHYTESVSDSRQKAPEDARM